MKNRIYTKEEVMANFANERENARKTGQTWRNFYIGLAEKAYLAGKPAKMKEEREYSNGAEIITSYMSDGTIETAVYNDD